MRVLVDGYNVTKGDPATSGMTLEEQRTALVRRLAVRGRDLLGAGAITVVFDGRLGYVSDTAGGLVSVRFSRDEPADDLIVRLAASAAEDVRLVSSDRSLADRVRAAVAPRSVTVLERSAAFEAARSTRGKRKGTPTGGLPKGANRITEELKGIWLADDE